MALLARTESARRVSDKGHGDGPDRSRARAMEQGQDRWAEGAAQAQGHLGRSSSSAHGSPRPRVGAVEAWGLTASCAAAISTSSRFATCATASRRRRGRSCSSRRLRPFQFEITPPTRQAIGTSWFSGQVAAVRRRKAQASTSCRYSALHGQARRPAISWAAESRGGLHQRQLQREFGAAARTAALHLDDPAVELNEVLDNRQSDS